MRRDLKPEAITTPELGCPSCGAPMEVTDRFTLYGAPAPVEHVKVRCAVGHWYTIPNDWLARPARDPQHAAAFRELAGNQRPRTRRPTGMVSGSAVRESEHAG